jgi:hypothetical protein
MWRARVVTRASGRDEAGLTDRRDIVAVGAEGNGGSDMADHVARLVHAVLADGLRQGQVLLARPSAQA